MKNQLYFFFILLIPLTAVTQNIEVVGTIKIKDGTQGTDKILTSDADGLASWQPAPSDSPPATYYESVNICCNSWMTKNLDVATYRNGDPIPKVEDAAVWAALTTGAYCYYNNDSTTYASIYGKLYNFHAVNDSRGLAPEGWHVPTDFEWTTSIDCLGGSDVAGGLLKEIETAHWNSPNTGASNVTGFIGLPGGQRIANGSFYGIGEEGNWWGSTVEYLTFIWSHRIVYEDDYISNHSVDMEYGFSVRCIRDD